MQRQAEVRGVGGRRMMEYWGPLDYFILRSRTLYQFDFLYFAINLYIQSNNSPISEVPMTISACKILLPGIRKYLGFYATGINRAGTLPSSSFYLLCLQYCSTHTPSCQPSPHTPAAHPSSFDQFRSGVFRKRTQRRGCQWTQSYLNLNPASIFHDFPFFNPFFK